MDPITWLATPEFISPATYDWETINSTNVPEGASGVVLQRLPRNAPNVYTGGRPKGSVANNIGAPIQNSGGQLIIGCDGNGDFDLFGRGGEASYYLLGYLGEGFVSLGAQPNLDIQTYGSYVEKNIDAYSGSDTPKAVMLVLKINSGSGGTNNMSVRKKGSTTDNYDGAMSAGLNMAIVGTDANKKFEVKVGINQNPFVYGYFKSGVVMRDNALDVTPSTGSGTWKDLAALPIGALAGIYEHLQPSGYGDIGFIGIRPKGSSDTSTYQRCSPHGFMVCPCNVDGIVQAKIDDISYHKLFLVGYLGPDNSTSPTFLNRFW